MTFDAYSIINDIIEDAFSVARTCREDSPAIIEFAGETREGDWAAYDIVVDNVTYRVSAHVNDEIEDYTIASNLSAEAHNRAGIVQAIALLVCP